MTHGQRNTKFITVSRSFVLRMRNVSDKRCRGNKNTRLWDGVEKYGTAGQATDDSMMRRMSFECRITEAKDKHSDYVILIDFPWQQ